MELLPAELRARLPALYTQERVADPVVHLKFFTPHSNWTWFATEGSPHGDDFLFFGYVIGFAEEWGYFALSELHSLCECAIPQIERDLFFQPGSLSEVLARHRTEHGER